MLTPRFSASIPASCRAAVEALFFFNPRQQRLRHEISATIEETGMPTIVEADGRIWIEVRPTPMQCLFVCDAKFRPGGVALYTRPNPRQLWIVHLAAVDDESPEPTFETSPALLLVEEIRGLARAIKGIERIRLPYTHRFLQVRTTR